MFVWVGTLLLHPGSETKTGRRLAKHTTLLLLHSVTLELGKTDLSLSHLFIGIFLESLICRDVSKEKFNYRKRNLDSEIG